jgi:ElaB/YqjD/DUF883 family membrane-anchored ribosome-binding protein
MKRNKMEQIRKLLEANPNIKTEQVMAKLGVAKSYAYVLMSKAKKALANDHARRSEVRQRLEKMRQDLEQGTAKIRMESAERVEQVADPVNSPAHYTAGGIETIDFIEAKGLDYHLGNVVKYITRADHKGSKQEDLRKAHWYLTRAIERAKV